MIWKKKLIITLMCYAISVLIDALAPQVSVHTRVRQYAIRL